MHLKTTFQSFQSYASPNSSLLTSKVEFVEKNVSITGHDMLFISSRFKKKFCSFCNPSIRLLENVQVLNWNTGHKGATTIRVQS